MPELTVERDPGASRYLAVLDGQAIGEAVYRDTDEGRVFTHTVIQPGHEGHGYGTALVRGALDDTREAGLTPIGQCSMVRGFLEQHPEYARPLAS